MSSLPKGWANSELCNITEVVSGNAFKSKDFVENGIPVVKISNVQSGKYIEKNQEYLPDSFVNESNARFIVNHNDLLIALTRPIVSNKLKVCTYPNKKQVGLLNQRVARLDVYEGSSERFLHYYLSSKGFKESVQASMSETLQPNLSPKSLSKIRIDYPPLAEQKRIVEKLDEVLAQVDTIKARLDGIPAILKRFRQSVLASAVSGKLTEEWRKENEGGCSPQQVEHIIESRKALVTKRMQIPQEHLKNEEYPIPEEWKWVSLDLLSSKIVDGVHHKPEYVEEGIPFMSVKDIKGGKIYFDNCKYVSLETHDIIHPRCNPEKGDLLITKSGTIGRTAIIKTDDIFDLFVSVALIKPASKKVNMEFINIALMHWVNSIDVSSRVVGTAIKNLHLRDMRVLAVPFAPLTEQKEIVRLVDQYLDFADTIEAQVKKAQTRVDNLTQSILAKAFRGELVPQDPNDEPADKLLERIAQARKEAEALTKAAKKAAPKKRTTKAKTTV